MQDLAKRLGLKPSQVYKWQWDLKKKEVEDIKMKKMCYPNEIFQVLDPQGKNISKPVTPQFLISKKQLWE